jgi:hypothetical protein
MAGMFETLRDQSRDFWESANRDREAERRHEERMAELGAPSRSVEERLNRLDARAARIEGMLSEILSRLPSRQEER